MTLTADSGSTKTTWLLDSGMDRNVFRTQGINPFLQTEDDIRRVVTHELLRQDGFPAAGAVDAVRFYGAGCNRAKAPLLRRILCDIFPNAAEVEVDSDMLGAARALCGSREGIACILGTGANSCLYDGQRIVSNVSPMGYILGDEGSGAVLGRTFVNMLYKDGHEDTLQVFEKETGLTQADIIQRVYREAMPNRFLASLAPFIRRYADDWEWIDEMVVDCFRLFFRRNIRHYARPDLPCSFVGSIAYHFERQLRRAANSEGFLIGVLMKEPLSMD
ncbi:MAG: ATPase [Prevotellaceae bacterium]|nr:ATPase [Prevotellaceae bacterium]